MSKPIGTALAVVALALLTGCDTNSTPKAKRGPAAQTTSRGGLFELVAENLDRLEQFETSEIRRQICDRLNQWNLQEKPKVNWQLDPLVGQLAPDYRNMTAVKLLDSPLYQAVDAEYLQEATWLRDISRQARGNRFEDLDVAQQLFDWTIRNIQLEPDVEGAPRHRVYQTLLLGRGSAIERAWVFMLLARQQGLDVVMLAPEGEPSHARLCALLVGEELYLFDCGLGLPIPGPQGRGIATLAQVAADDALLRRLDLDVDHPYPLMSADLERAVAFIEGSAENLSRRMELVESRLSGKRKLRLTSPGNSLAERLKKLPHVADARLWTWPFEVTLAQSSLTPQARQAAEREMLVFRALPDLAKARSLYFKGSYDGDRGAKKYLLDMRPPDSYVNNYKLPADTASRVKQEDISKVEAGHIVLIRQAKQSASYWLGLVMFQQDDFTPAIDYFAKRTLEATPRGPWSSGARYNLGRTYEATGDIPRAIEMYESDEKSPQSHGNRLRARWLKEKSAAAAS